MSSSSKEPVPVEIFYCYAREDEKFVNDLDRHLSYLKTQKRIVTWFDGKIDAGQEWDSAIKKHLNMANIIVLFVSSDFLASDYCHSVELVTAMRRHDKEEAIVIPIIVRASQWKDTLLGTLQVLPKNAVPINSFGDKDFVYNDIVNSIKETINKISPSSQTSLIPLDSPIINTDFSLQNDNDKDDLQIEEKNKLTYRKGIEELLERGKKYCVREEFNTALEIFDHVTCIDEKNADAYYWKGNALYFLRFYEEALIAYKICIRINPDNLGSYYMRGNVFYLLKHYDEALIAYNLCLRQPAIQLDCLNMTKPISSVIASYYGKGCVLYHLKKYEDVIFIYENEPPSTQTSKNRLGDYIFDQIIELYDHLLYLSSKDAAILYGKCFLLYQKKHFGEATFIYEEASHLDPNNSVAYYCESSILYALQHYEKAIVAYDKLLKIAPRSIIAYKRKGKALYALKKHELALEVYEQYLRFNPTDIEAIASKINSLKELKRNEEALILYDKIYIDEELNESSRVARFSDRIFENKRNNIRILIEKGDLLCEMKRYSEAMVVYRQTSSVFGYKKLSREKMMRTLKLKYGNWLDQYSVIMTLFWISLIGFVLSIAMFMIRFFKWLTIFDTFGLFVNCIFIVCFLILLSTSIVIFFCRKISRII